LSYPSICFTWLYLSTAFSLTTALYTPSLFFYFFFFFNNPATTDIYTLSLHDALPISPPDRVLQTAGTVPGCPEWLDRLWPTGPAERANREQSTWRADLRPLCG